MLLIIILIINIIIYNNNNNNIYNIILILLNYLILLVMLSVFLCRTKRSQIAITEGIFELPNLTIQATRAQTLLLHAIYQSWSHSGNVSSLAVNEALMNEVFQPVGKNIVFLTSLWKSLI